MLLQAVADKGIQSLVKSFYECIIRYTKYFAISLAISLPQNSTVTIVSVKFDTSMKIYIDLYKIVYISQKSLNYL